MRTILIATNNPGKFHEISTEFKDLNFTFVSLKDVGLGHIDLEEPHHTTWENALHKAKFFAKKSKLLTIAEDSGLFVKHLKGAPGVGTKRFAATPEERIQKILNELKGVPIHKRSAYFETSGCVYDPSRDSFTLFKGTVEGKIALKSKAGARAGMEYDAVFYYPPAKKLFIDMNPTEKNLVSHRGQVAIQIKYFLANQYAFKQILAPLALVIKDKKILLLKRRDSRKEFNNKWEFPGGGVENNETVEKCLVRETKEETGFEVKIIDRIPKIYSTAVGVNKGNYQVFLIVYICSIKSGKLQLTDNESAGADWFSYSQLLKADLLPLNKKLVRENRALLKKYIA